MWFYNPDPPYFNGTLPFIELHANTTKIVTFPPIEDVDGYQTWHSCDITLISGFATYDNKTKTLLLYPGPSIIGTYHCSCTLNDIYTPSHTVTTQFTVKVDPPIPIA